MAEIYIVSESYCGDPFEIHEIFSTLNKAEEYLSTKNTAKCLDCDGIGVINEDCEEFDSECPECRGTGKGYDKDVFTYNISSYEIDRKENV